MKAGHQTAAKKQLIKTTQTKSAAKTAPKETDQMSIEDKLMSDLNSLQFPLGSGTTIKIEVDSRRR